MFAGNLSVFGRDGGINPAVVCGYIELMETTDDVGGIWGGWGEW